MVDERLKIAVIGNGPSPVGKGWGEGIDKCDRIVRLHDCQYQNAEDYGRRYDIGIVPPWWQTAMKGIVRYPSQWWLYHFGIVKEIDTYQPCEMFGRIVGFFDLSASNNIAREKGKAPSGRRASLSRGFAALVMTSMVYPESTIFAYGFDALFSDQSLTEWPNPPDYKKMVETDMKDCGLYHSTAVHHDALLERSLLPANVIQVI